MERPPSFQFYPRDFLADMQIHGIGVGLGGRYLWALCCSWMTDTPGVAAEEQWVAWMGLTGEQWISVREKMLACFKVGSDGKLVQKRMVEEREAQRLRHERSVMGGKLSAERRATKPAPLEGSTSTAPTPASALDSKSTPLLAGASENGREPAKAASRQKQSLASDEFRAFWDAYKHRRRRGWGQALAVWKRYRGDLIAAQIMAALQRDKRSPKWDEYAPEPERWLKKTPWEHTEDNPDETVISTTEDRWS